MTTQPNSSAPKANNQPPPLRLCPAISPYASLVEVALNAPPLGWESVFADALPELSHLDWSLAGDQKYGGYAPEPYNLFRAFRLCPLHKVKVVIIGQDPYPGNHRYGGCRAQGMSFSVDSMDDQPPSMRSIFEELGNNFPGWRPEGPGNLTLWALQGVLLLNAALTLREELAPNGKEKKNVHKKWWEGFITKVLQAIARERPGSIYVMWGNDAKAFETITDTRGEKLTASHPSPQAARNGNNPFIGCGHFRRINEILVQKGEQPINWRVL